MKVFVLLAAVELLVLSVTAGVVFLPVLGSSTPSGSEISPRLVVAIGYTSELHQPGGQIVVAFAIGVNGSTPPYTFVARWSDGTIQNSTTGAFSRIVTNETFPGYVTVTVTGGDGQKKSITIQFPVQSTTTANSNSSSSSSTLSTTASASPQASATMTAALSYLRSINGSGGVVTVFFGIDVHGGTTPYNFLAKWSDGIVQTSNQGTFTRTFTNNTIPDSVYVTVISGDGQTTAVNVTIPAG